jgi:hypothetical protein
MVSPPRRTRRIPLSAGERDRHPRPPVGGQGEGAPQLLHHKADEAQAQGHGGAEVQADRRPLPLPAEREVHLDAELHRTLARLTDPEACLNVAGRALATEIRILRGAGTAPGDLSVK